MTGLVLPKLKRNQRRYDWCGNTIGSWITADERFVVFRASDEIGWRILQLQRLHGLKYPEAAGQHWLERVGLYDGRFPTRREALEALALALHVEGGP